MLSATAPLPAFTQAMALGVGGLFALSWLIQTLEFARIFASPQGDWWDWSLQRADIPNPWLRSCADQLFSAQGMRWQMRLRILAGLALPGLIYSSVMTEPGLGSSPQSAGHFTHWVFWLTLATTGLLTVLHVLMLIRWRGAFNGGSDFMTLMVLLGLLLASTVSLLGHPALGWRAGFAFITLQAISSYFLSGSVKLLRPEWRSGQAMTLFLNEAVRGPLSTRHWARRPLLARWASWSFILWECAFPLALWQADWALLFCTVAAVFHFLVFWFFGLNRFFWAWLATFPAIIWCAAVPWN